MSSEFAIVAERERERWMLRVHITNGELYGIVAERERDRWMLRVHITNGELYGIHVHFDSNNHCLE